MTKRELAVLTAALVTRMAITIPKTKTAGFLATNPKQLVVLNIKLWIIFGKGDFELLR